MTIFLKILAAVAVAAIAFFMLSATILSVKNVKMRTGVLILWSFLALVAIVYKLLWG